jgi:hypothetical protein
MRTSCEISLAIMTPTYISLILSSNSVYPQKLFNRNNFIPPFIANVFILAEGFQTTENCTVI